MRLRARVGGGKTIYPSSSLRPLAPPFLEAGAGLAATFRLGLAELGNVRAGKRKRERERDMGVRE